MILINYFFKNLLFENEEWSDTTRKSDKEESSDTSKADEKSTDLPPMLPLEGDEEEGKEGKGTIN